MDFRQLDAYINAYELKSFSRAAEKMFLSQPSISAYINSLEKELQTQLIYRSTKEFIPTKSGVLFYQYARDMLSLRDNSIHSMKNICDSNAGSIDILASSVPSHHILPQILGSFHKLYPNILFNLQQADSTEVIKGISSYKSEVGFVGARIENSTCTYKDFMSERLVMIAPWDERFHNINSENIKEFVYNEYFIMREEGSGTRLRYEEYLKRLGVDLSRLKVSAQLSNTQNIIDAVANGLGISIVSELAAKHYISQKRITSIEVCPLSKRNFYIVLKKNRIQTPIVDAFVEFVCSYEYDKPTEKNNLPNN